MVELSGGHARGLLNLAGIGKTLSGERITTEETPPAFLQIEPARSFGYEEVLNAWMICQPGARLKTVMTAEIISNHEHVACRMVRFDVGKQSNVAFRVARRSTFGQLLAITHPSCPIDPGFLRPTAVIHRGFDAMPISRPSRSWRKGARNSWSKVSSVQTVVDPFGGCV